MIDSDVTYDGILQCTKFCGLCNTPAMSGHFCVHMLGPPDDNGFSPHVCLVDNVFVPMDDHICVCIQCIEQISVDTLLGLDKLQAKSFHPVFNIWDNVFEMKNFKEEFIAHNPNSEFAQTLSRKYSTKNEVPWKGLTCKLLGCCDYYKNQSHPVAGWEPTNMNGWDLRPRGSAMSTST